MINPLLEGRYFPPFKRIDAADVIPALDQILSHNRDEIASLLKSPPMDWSLIQRLEAIDDRLNKAWSPVSHMNAVINNDELRQAYNAALPKLSEYNTELGQNEELFHAYKKLADSDAYKSLDTAQQQLLNNALRDFKLSGIDLSKEDRKRYGELQKRLSELASQFSENVLDATQAWSKHFDSADALSGLPESSLALAAQAAKEKDKEGYCLTLDFPSYYSVMAYADNRELRQEVYQAYATRASDQGPTAGQWDNSTIIDELLSLRHAVAQLLGFDNYAEYSLATKMAESTDQVVDFLEDLATRSVSRATDELQELERFAHKLDGIESVEPWDLGYYSERLRQDRYALSQEELRPYFPIERVLSGLFEIVGRLFGISVEEIGAEKLDASGVELWHVDARFFEVTRQGQRVGYFYLDLYARSNKRGGAWMDECRVRRRLEDGSLQLPVAYLVCNFNPPVADQPALLTHNEVTTLFHEFGHGLHHLLTEVEWAAVSGINGVAWDAVELPSQFLENWCWQPEALSLISGHYQSKESLPAELLERMLAARDFQSGMQMVRQLEFALFDFVLHRDYCLEPLTDVQQVLDDIRSQVAVIKVPEYNRFQNSFSHIFSGGYAAGYYSYKWAEVLAADSFSRFEEEGVFNPQTGSEFLASILSKGGAAKPMALFIDFMGREPQVDALLRQVGLLPESSC
ncbi:oligopeptidase A [Motiliproteus sp. MSK22-1]|uniref:oligopeptidase A n=1 Tax=Motiliproteus sp. MSK22-1 TaxID=1897630 RepID=UPI00117C6801|nr:oligopeptidase A [Motiliproteus sp. MSK22-1]